MSTATQTADTATHTASQPAAANPAGPFRILAADKLAQEGLDFITSQHDAELVNKPGLSEDELAKEVATGGYHAMIVRSGVTVTDRVLADPGTLRVIARAGVGVDNIDLAAATAAGILVVNTAEASTITTAEHALTLMMAMFRNIGPASRTMFEGGWDRAKFKGRQAAGKTLGIVGFGRIGQTLAKRALALEMNVVGYDPFFGGETALDGQVKMYNDFEAILPHCDVLSFHVPLNDQTRGMLNKDTFAKCRKGVHVVNASRGGVVDEAGLIAALDDGTAAAAALDVFVDEPPAENSPLRRHPKVLCTPHLGASTVEAQQAVSIDAAKACLAYLRGQGVHGAVNVRNLRVDLDERGHAFVDLAHRMATLIDPMVTRGIARVDIDLIGKGLGPAASMVERTALVALLQSHLSDPVNLINVLQLAEQRGIAVDTTTTDRDAGNGAELRIEITGPSAAVDTDVDASERTRRIVGRVYDDGRPRVVDINHYAMDMVPAGEMILLLNADQPGMIGAVGSAFGQVGVNIADMSISRRQVQAGPDAGTTRAMMVLKIDAKAPQTLLDHLREHPGILKFACVDLPAEPA